MIDAINRREQGHIITLEDPIEYAFISNKCCDRAARSRQRRARLSPAA